jgi:Ca-activated chloride channel family protein
MRSTLILLFFACFACFAGTSSAQSGRRKPSPTPTPQQIVGPSVINLPPQAVTPAPSPKAKPAGKEESDEIIKVNSVLVPIPVSVLDANGRAVTDLKLTDFELKIEGKSVPISDIARSEAPIRLAMLFDNSSSVLIARDFEREAAVRFFRRVIRPDRDKAALFSVADITRLEQPITSDVDSLTRAIELFPEPAGATALLDGIIRAADYLRSTNGRRVIVIVSDGEDTYSDSTLDSVLKALQLDNCQVFVVRTTDFENYKRTGSRFGSANTRVLDAERRMADITAQTGGIVFSPVDEREVKDAFDRISAELSQQYVLSYYPEDTTEKAGDFRSISLAVKGKNSSVRTRKGYYVPKK